jgi:hypothetical protein
VKTEEEIRKMIEQLKGRKSWSSNMNYETSGAIEALEWVLKLREYLATGLR